MWLVLKNQFVVPLAVMALVLVTYLVTAAQATPHQKTVAERLVDAAMERTTHQVTYDGTYRSIDYPNGDVPNNIGVCTDVVIRSYRALGIDLQKLVHEDMKIAFSEYPNLEMWGLTAPDTNIDHRRVLNLRVFFKRHGQSLPITSVAENYRPGDLVTWDLAKDGDGTKLPHIGIVADEMTTDGKRPQIIHNIGSGPEMTDILFSFKITGHYRYKGPNPSEQGS